METKGKLIIAGVVTTGLLAGCVAYGMRTKRRDRQSALFLSELERKIAPGSVGLAQSDAFNMYYWQNLAKTVKKSYYLLKQKDAVSAAKSISDAWGVFDDDEDKIYGVFRALKDQAAVSQVAYWYYQKNKINLIDDLRSRLDEKTEVKEITGIVDKLPPYRIAKT